MNRPISPMKVAASATDDGTVAQADRCCRAQQESRKQYGQNPETLDQAARQLIGR